MCSSLKTCWAVFFRFGYCLWWSPVRLSFLWLAVWSAKSCSESILKRSEWYEYRQLTFDPRTKLLLLLLVKLLLMLSHSLWFEIVLFTSCIVIVGISGQVKSAGHFLIAFLLMLWDHTPPSPNEMYLQIKMFYDDLSSNTLLYIILVFITLLYTLKSIFPM